MAELRAAAPMDPADEAGGRLVAAGLLVRIPDDEDGRQQYAGGRDGDRQKHRVDVRGDYGAATTAASGFPGRHRFDVCFESEREELV